MSQIVFVSEAAAMLLHRRQISEHGGQDGVRDAGLLASVLARPENILAYEPSESDFGRLAASLAFGSARNHPFLDGNKRTALVVSRTFLLLNGHDIEASPEEKYLTFLRLAAGEIEESELIFWFRRRLTRRVE